MISQNAIEMNRIKNSFIFSRIIVVQSESGMEEESVQEQDEGSGAMSLQENQGVNLFILAGHEAMQF